MNEFRIFQQSPTGEWNRLIAIPEDQRSVIVDCTLNDTNNVFGIQVADDGNLTSGMTECNLGVPPGDIDQFSVIIVVSGVN